MASSRTRKPWRERTNQEQIDAQATRAKRWFATVVLASLAAIFYWLLSPPPPASKIAIAYLPVAYSRASVPPVLFAQHDVEALRQVAGGSKTDLPSSSGEMRVLNLQREAAGLTQPQDTLVLYLSAHGIATLDDSNDKPPADGKSPANSRSAGDGTPAGDSKSSRAADAKPRWKGYLLCSDFAMNDTAQERIKDGVGCIEITTLLRQLTAIKGPNKLLILDAGRWTSQPRFGVLVNEFPRCLAQAVADTHDDTLWVLTANGADERSHVSYADQRSVFGYFVECALSGSASPEKPKNSADIDSIDLGALTTYVGSNVAHWVKQNSEGETQVPQILWGGGATRDAEFKKSIADVRLAVTRPKDSEVAAKPAPDAEPKKAPPSDAKAPQANRGGGGFHPALALAMLSASAQVGSAQTTDPQATAATPAAPAAAQPAPAQTAPGPAAPGSAPAGDATKPAAAAANGDAAAQPTSPAPAAGSPPAAPGSPGAPAAGNPPAPPSPANATTPSSANATTPSPANTTTPSPASAAAKPADPSGQWPEKYRPLDRAWRKRDAMRQEAARFSPVDYAPQLWRYVELEMLKRELLFAEQGALAGSDPLAARQVSLDTAGSDFEQAGNAGARLLDETDTLRSAYRSRNANFHRAVDLLDWHARKTWDEKSQSPVYRELETFLNDLATLDQSLCNREAWDDSQLEKLTRQRRLLEESWKTLQDRLQAEVDSLVNPARRSSRPDKPVRKMEDLLSTPLLSCDQRVRLMIALEKTGAGLTKAGKKDAPQGSTPMQDLTTFSQLMRESAESADSLPSWTRAMEQAALEQKLIAIVDSRAASGMDKLSADGLAVGRASNALGAFYRKLPRQIEIEIAGAGPERNNPEFSHAEHGVRLVAMDKLSPNPAARIDWTPRGLSFDNESSQVLQFDDGGKAQDISVRLRAKGGFQGNAEITLQYKPNQVQVRRKDGSTVEPNAKRVEPFASSDAKVLEYQVKLQKSVKPGERGLDPIVISAVAKDGQRVSHRVRCELLAPNRIDLVVEPAARVKNPKLLAPPPRDNHQLIKTFPGHDTSFVFLLRQYTRNPRKVNVKLYKVRDDDEPWVAQLRATEENPQPLIGDKALQYGPSTLLAEAMNVDLSAGGDATPIPFQRPAAAAAPPAKPESQPKQPAAPPAAAQPKSVTGGMICVIEDPKADASWVTWIDCTALAPKEYVDPEVAFDFKQRELTVKFREVDLQPADGQPVQVFWRLYRGSPDAAGGLEPLGASEGGNSEMKLNRANVQGGIFGGAPLQARLPASQEAVEIHLDIDGYPRAMIFTMELNANRTKDGGDREKGLQRFEFLAPQNNRVLASDPDSVRKNPLDIKFAVTVPETAFAPGRGDSVVVAWDKHGSGNDDMIATYYTERRVKLTIPEDGISDGQVKIHTDVNDFELSTSRLRGFNGKAELRGRLACQKYQDKVEDLSITFDSEPPVVDAVEQGQAEYFAESPGELIVRARDALSGVKIVEYLEVEAGIESVKDEDAVKSKKKEVPPGMEPHNPSVPVKLEKLTEGEHTYLVWATDMAGLNSRARPEKITINVGPKKVEPPPGAPPGSSPMAKKDATIKGRVVYNKQGVGKITVKLGDTPGAKETKSDDKGEFTFKNVLPGTYTLVAKGVAKNQTRTGTGSVTVPTPAADPDPVDIELK